MPRVKNPWDSLKHPNFLPSMSRIKLVHQLGTKAISGFNPLFPNHGRTVVHRVAPPVIHPICLIEGLQCHLAIQSRCAHSITDANGQLEIDPRSFVMGRRKTSCWTSPPPSREAPATSPASALLRPRVHHSFSRVMAAALRSRAFTNERPARTQRSSTWQTH